MVPPRAIVRRLNVSPNSFVNSGVYVEIYSTFIVSLCLVRIDLVKQSCKHDSECLVSPFRPLGALAVPVSFAFYSFGRFHRNSASALPQVNWDARARRR
eukprot:9286317-Pyramimonas_sp.AAC.1